MSLLTYSGITTKVRAMQSHLVDQQNLKEMAELEHVRNAAEYLKKMPAYEEIFSNLEDDQLHRGHIEALLTLSKYRDFAKLYGFSNLPQRKFLDLYFMHYEIAIIKTCLRNVMSHQKSALDLSMFRAFFQKHSPIDFIQMAQAETLQELLILLEDSRYYGPMMKSGDITSNVLPTMLDFEMRLDLFYFKSIWNIKNKGLTKKEQRILKQCFGCRLDMLNIQWIYRSKKYYDLSSADIYGLLIPIQYRLKSDQIQAMVESSTLKDFFEATERTYYGKITPEEFSDTSNVEVLYEEILNQLYETARRQHPYSIATLDSYLHFKEVELQKIITTIEGIRYGLSAKDILSLVITDERRANR